MVFPSGYQTADAILVWEPVGRRPYEMDWANRTEDVRPALVDFEDIEGWTTACVEANAAFTCSRQQPLWGRDAGRLAYHGTAPRAETPLHAPYSPVRMVPASVPCLC